jgi:hypothetical protein
MDGIEEEGEGEEISEQERKCIFTIFKFRVLGIPPN